MFRTIRWRLAASYAAIILLTVTLMGALSLSFLGRHMGRQEREFLNANAGAVASQAAEFLRPPVRRLALDELAYASAFLGNARVRILDQNKTALADSGDPSQPDEFIWLVPSSLAEIDRERRGAAPFIITLPNPSGPGRQRSLRELLPLLRDLPLGTSRVYARRFFTPWGRRFVFEGAEQPSRSPRAEDALRHMITVTLPVGGPDTPPGPSGPLGYVELSSPLSLQREAIATMSGSLLTSGLGALAVAIAFGLFMGKTFTDPVRSLAAAAKRMADGDLSARAPGKRPDELGALARQFNGMADSLERNFRDLCMERDSLKRFIADASHELRTPITALSTFTELLQGSAAEDPAARAEFLQESGKQLARLQWITANLLDLSRLDAGIASLDFAVHDAGDMLEEAAAPLRARAAEKGVSLEVAPPDPPLRVTCDRQRMIMALSNLVANAARFTPAGASVRLRAEAVEAGAASRTADREPRVRFVVENDGEGIDPQDLPHIFERFYRGRNGGEEGAGLGLAIVKSVAEAHGGTVLVENTPGKGCVFTIEVPAGALK